MPHDHTIPATAPVIGRRIDELPVPERREAGRARRGPDGTIAVYDLQFPARPWHVVYFPDPQGVRNLWLAEQETEHWKDLVEADASAATVHVLLSEYEAKLRALRVENGRLSAALGTTRTQLARARENSVSRADLAAAREQARELSDRLSAIAGHGEAAPGTPGPGSETVQPAPPAHKTAAWPPDLTPGAAWTPTGTQNADDRGHRYAAGDRRGDTGQARVRAAGRTGCRFEHGTWIHYPAPHHTCPDYVRGDR